MTEESSGRMASSAAAFILNRWSPRAFVPADITEVELLSLLEAGRWAPSAYNRQPWRFVYARRATSDWDKFLSWLIPFNYSWAENASAIVYVVSQTGAVDPKSGEWKDNPTHAFDAGAASVLVQLQALHNGWAAHPISGFDHAQAREGLGLPEDYALHAAIVIGRRGSKDLLPVGLSERESPSDRLPLKDVIMSGRFV
ncbi:nitroreductase family protein [Acetobacter syzygii]|uniref:nitroreductase family protein n=1 Tax=Acetobacter syzygii TaxID=146476 RepID=UPI0039EC967F